jgi:uncharacterized protein (TIGR04222 family)
VVYSVGFGAIVLITALVWQVMRGLPSHRPVRQLDQYEIAFLAGGKLRVAEVAIAEMVDHGAIRVDSKGRLTDADPSARGGPFAGSLGSIPPSGMTTHAARGKISGDPVIKTITARLRADGLIISGERIIVLRWLIVLLMSALLGTGIARLIEGHQNHRPTSDLAGLVVFSVIAGIWLLASANRKSNLTRHGRWYLRRLRRVPLTAGVPLTSVALPGAPFAFDAPFQAPFGAAPVMATAAVFGVALWGFKAIPDQTIRAALIAGQASSSSVSGCGGGGGGCGGGGCGGGCGG